MDRLDLKQVSRQVSQDLGGLRQELVGEWKRLEADLEDAQLQLQKAYGEGDLRENAEFEAAVSRCSLVSSSLQMVDEKLQRLNSFDENEEYYPIGMVVMFSTVLLTNNVDEGQYVFKLYPAGVSDIERKILALDSPIGQAIYLKGKGSMFSMEHHVTGVLRVWKIEDVY